MFLNTYVVDQAISRELNLGILIQKLIHILLQIEQIILIVLIVIFNKSNKIRHIVLIGIFSYIIVIYMINNILFILKKVNNFLCIFNQSMAV